MKEKAKELVQKFLPHMYCFMGSGMLSNDYDIDVAIDNAKKCAEYMAYEIYFLDTGDTIDKNFWLGVIKEINKITSNNYK